MVELPDHAQEVVRQVDDAIRRAHVPSVAAEDWATIVLHVAGAALFGAPFWLARRDRRLLIILWFTASWSLIFLASVPLTRYHFAIIPMITILAAVAFVSTWDWYANRKPSGEQGGVA